MNPPLAKHLGGALQVRPMSPYRVASSIDHSLDHARRYEVGTAGEARPLHLTATMFRTRGREPLAPGHGIAEADAIGIVAEIAFSYAAAHCADRHRIGF